MHQLNLLMKRMARMHYCILPPVYSCLLLLLLSFSANYQNREDRTMDDPFGESLALAPTAPLSEYRTTNRVGDSDEDSSDAESFKYNIHNNIH